MRLVFLFVLVLVGCTRSQKPKPAPIGPTVSPEQIYSDFAKMRRRDWSGRRLLVRGTVAIYRPGQGRVYAYYMLRAGAKNLHAITPDAFSSHEGKEVALSCTTMDMISEPWLADCEER